MDTRAVTGESVVSCEPLSVIFFTSILAPIFEAILTASSCSQFFRISSGVGD